MFAGGGISGYLAAQMGWEIGGACEIDKLARAVYRYNNRPEWEIDHDARKLIPKRMPGFDCLIFGWPCQDNSVAGKRAGQKEGTRSGLLNEAARILRAKRPAYFIAENVPGLFSVNSGGDFYPTIDLFTDVGYDVQWQVLNSSWFLPQNRKRIYFVGHRRGKSRPEIFPFTKHDFDYEARGGEGSHRVLAKGCDSPYYKGADGKRTVVMEVGNYHAARGYTPTPNGLVPKCLAKHGDRRPIIKRLDAGAKYYQDRIYSTDGLAPALPTGTGGNHQPTIFVSSGRVNKSSTDMTTESEQAHALTPPPNVHGIRAVITPGREKKRQHGRVKKEIGEPMFSLTTRDVHGIDQEGELRYLTPLEYERLFGFPDGYTARGIDDHGNEIAISDSQRYKICGNAMVAPVIGAVMEKLKTNLVKSR